MSTAYSLPPVFPPPWVSGFGEDAGRGVFAEVELPGDVVLRWRWVPPGRFMMGSPEDEVGRDDERLHAVELTSGFWLAETPCTQAQWKAVMGENPSHFTGDDARPVESVNWDECVNFCRRLSQVVPGLAARLPTEAEWEYACRAGTGTAFNDGSECSKPSGKDPALARLGWHEDGFYQGTTHPVGELEPNRYGLFDMHGNVWEWCADWIGSYPEEELVDPTGPEAGVLRVVRGGCYWFPARGCRSAYRFRCDPSLRLHDLGFRPAAGQPEG